MIAVLVVVLASVFAACGEKETGKNNSTNGNGGTTGDGIMINGIPTEEELEACIAFVYNTTREKDNKTSIQLYKYHDWTYENDLAVLRGLDNQFFITTSNYDRSNNSWEIKNLYIYTYKDAESAEKAMIDRFEQSGEEEAYVRDGKQLYSMVLTNETDYTYFEQSLDKIKAFYKEVMASKLSAGAMSDERYEFIKDTFMQYTDKEVLYDENINNIAIIYESSSEDPKENTFLCSLLHNGTNAETRIYCSNYTDTLNDLREDLPKLSELYTSDSYIDFDKEEGYVFAKLTDKVKDDSGIE